MVSAKDSYLIVGAGVFGVSTAYYIIKKYPNASVTIVDRDHYEADNRVAASWDWNKVIRADYDDLVYCRLGLEAQDIFETDPLWQPYFHKTGIFWICRSDYAQAVIDNYKKLGRKADLKAVSVEEARKMHNGLFDEADYTGAKEVLVNKTSGWAEAGRCLTAITRECVRLGVKYVTAEVAQLQMEESGRCYGIKTGRGDVLTASHVVLCTGAFTAKLLEQSAEKSGFNKLRAGPRIVAGGITTGMVRLDDEQYKQFADMPVGVQGYTNEVGTFVGSLPPTKDKEIKWWGQTIFQNTKEVSPGRHISVPPAESDYAQWKIPGKLKNDIEHAGNLFYGRKAANWDYKKHRICWDAFTSSGDFIISPHSASKGLYIATCGNFHGYKFFPVLGKYILQMLEGSLEPALEHKWAWDRSRPHPIANPDWPWYEMNQFLDSVRTSKL